MLCVVTHRYPFPERGFHTGEAEPGPLSWWPGIADRYDHHGDNIKGRIYSIPLWNLVAAFGVPCALMTRRLCTRKPREACHKCGYSRQGLETGSVCPECGSQDTITMA